MILSYITNFSFSGCTSCIDNNIASCANCITTLIILSNQTLECLCCVTACCSRYIILIVLGYNTISCNIGCSCRIDNMVAAIVLCKYTSCIFSFSRKVILSYNASLIFSCSSAMILSYIANFNLCCCTASSTTVSKIYVIIRVTTS